MPGTRLLGSLAVALPVADLALFVASSTTPNSPVIPLSISLHSPSLCLGCAWPYCRARPNQTPLSLRGTWKIPPRPQLAMRIAIRPSVFSRIRQEAIQVGPLPDLFKVHSLPVFKTFSLSSLVRTFCPVDELRLWRPCGSHPPSLAY